MRKIVSLLFLFTPLAAFAASSSGLITRTIWYAPEKFFSESKVRIYAGLFNGFDEDLQGTVEFFIDKKEIGKATFALERGGRAGSVWADWIAEYGAHTVSARIADSRLSGTGGEKPVQLENTSAELTLAFIDRDTDQDGIGDKEDSVDNRVKAQISQETAPVSPVGTSTTELILQKTSQALTASKEALEARRSTASDKKVLARTFSDLKDSVNEKDIPGVFSVAWEGSKAAGSLAAKTALASLAFVAQNMSWGAVIITGIATFILWLYFRRKRR